MESPQKRQNDCYNRKAYGCRFNPGDLGWMINKKPDLLLNKFHDRWLVPFKVTKRCSHQVYEIFDAQSGKTKRFHFNFPKAANRNKARKTFCHNAAAGETEEESYEEEVPFIDELPTLHAIANAAVPAGTQNAVTAKTAAPNQSAAKHLAFRPQASDNSVVPNSPIQSLAKSPAAIPVVNVEYVSTVAAPPTVEPVVPQRSGAQRYDLRPRPKPSTRDAFQIIVALILLLPLAACSSPISLLVGVARNSKNTLNYWASMGNVFTWAALVVLLILALITLIRLIVKSVRKLLLKCNLSSLATPSKVFK